MITTTWIRRLFAVAGSSALLAAGAVSLGTGNAHAQDAGASGSVMVYKTSSPTNPNPMWANCTRTVSPSTVAAGDTVTVTTKITPGGPRPD